MGQILSAYGGQAGGGYGMQRRPVGGGYGKGGYADFGSPKTYGGGNPYAPYQAGFGTDPRLGPEAEHNGPGGQWPGYYIGGGGPSGPPNGGSGNNTYNPYDPMGLGGAGGGGRRPVGPGQNSGGNPNWIGAPKAGGGDPGDVDHPAGWGEPTEVGGPDSGVSATPYPTTGMTMTNESGGNLQNPMRRRRGGYDREF